jgi:MGT family glycosyltransferase
MARYLFVVPPLTGHVNPTVAVGAALMKRGHTVAWVGHPPAVQPLLPEGATLLPLSDDDLLTRLVALRSAPPARGLLAFKQLWEEVFTPLARSMRPGVEAAVDRFKPDLMLVDQQAFAGALVARTRRLRWATLATTSARLVDSLADLPLVLRWVEAQLTLLQVEVGLEPTADPDLAPGLVLVFSSEALAGAGRFSRQARFVGPALGGRPETTAFPWDELRPQSRVFVSLGSIHSDQGVALHRVLGEALAEEPLQVILAAPEEAGATLPPNFLVRRRVPQLALLPHVQAVLCHGGHNTVCESLAHGLPVIAMPIRDDQPVIAQQVVAAGAGLRLRFGRTQPAELRAAVRRALTDPELRAGAARIQVSFQEAGGVQAAVRAIEAMP